MEIDRPDNADVPKRLKIPEMMVAGNDQVRFAFDRTFQYPIIVVIRRNLIDSESWNDYLRDFGQQLQCGNNVLVIPIETGAENSGQFIHNGRRHQK